MDPEQTTETMTNDAPTDDATGQQSDGGQAGAITFASEAELQAEIDRRLKERLEREKRKAEKAAEEARRKAEEAALAKNAEWQKLAEERAKRIAELEPLGTELEAARTEAERYKGALGTFLEEQRKGLPAHILALLNKLDPVEQLEYIAAHKEELAPKGGAGIPVTPKAADARELTQQQLAEARQRNAQRYRSRF